MFSSEKKLRTLSKNLIGISVLFLSTITSLFAAPGVTGSTITIGQSIPLTGPIGSYGVQLRDGANLYFQHINEQGGVNGRKIKLLSIDDGYEETKAVANTKHLIEKDNVFALFGYYGTASTLASMKVFSEAKVPLLSTISGAEALRDPVNRYMFNIRASYNDETEAIIKQLTSLGHANIAVFYQNDGFGKAGLDGVKAALKRRGLQASAEGFVERNSDDVNSAVEAISKVNPQAVVMVTLYKPTAKFVLGMKKKNLNPQFMALSPVAADLLVKELGAESRGIGISQVMPYPFKVSTPIASEYNAMTKKHKHAAASYYGIEGYIAAKVFVEALRKAGSDLTREKLIEALEATKSFDVGGYQVSFSSTNHSGSKFTELVVIGKDGKVIK